MLPDDRMFKGAGAIVGAILLWRGSILLVPRGYHYLDAGEWQPRSVLHAINSTE